MKPYNTRTFWVVALAIQILCSTVSALDVEYSFQVYPSDIVGESKLLFGKYEDLNGMCGASEWKTVSVSVGKSYPGYITAPADYPITGIIFSVISIPDCYSVVVNDVVIPYWNMGYIELHSNNDPPATKVEFTIKFVHSSGQDIEMMNATKEQDGTYTTQADGKHTVHARLALPDLWGTNVAWSIASADNLGCAINPTTGAISVGTRKGSIMVRANYTIGQGCFVDKELELQDCSSSCSACVIPANIGSRVRSLSLDISLGRGSYGVDNNILKLYSETNNNLGDPSALQLDNRYKNEYSYITNANGSLLQILVANRYFINITNVNSTSYNIDYYHWTTPTSYDYATNNQLYYYMPTNALFSRVSVADLDGVANETTWLRVVDGNNHTNDFRWTNGYWHLTAPEGLRTEWATTSWAGNLKTVTHYTTGASTQIVSVVRQTFACTNYLTNIVEEVFGDGPTAQTNSYAYDTNGNLTTVTRWDGSWELRQYDTSNRLAIVIQPFLSSASAATATTNNSRAFFYSYTGVGTEDDGSIEPFTPRTITETINGTPVSKRFNVLTNGMKMEIVCSVPSATWSDSGNLRTTSRFYTNGLFEGELKSVEHPDGTATLYEYAYGPGTLTNIVTQGVPSGTTISQGKQSITVKGNLGEILSEEVYAFDQSATNLIQQRTYGNFDNFQRAQTVTNLNSTVETMQYGCCGLESVTDIEGTTTSFGYDALGRQTTQTRNDIVSINQFDGAGRVFATQRQGTDSSTATLSQTLYDTAGNILAVTNAAGISTYYSNRFDGTYLVKTTTTPDGEMTEKYYRDGNLYERSGSTTFPLRFEYGIDTVAGIDREYRKEIKINGTNDSDWTLSYKDGAGRWFKSVHSGTSSPTALTVFNSKGQVERQTDPDGVTRMFYYNNLGEMVYEILDMNGNYSSNSTDRITQYWHEYRVADGHLWEVRGTQNPEEVTSETLSALDTNLFEQSVYGLTTTTTTELDGQGGRTVTVTAPDTSYTVSTYQNGYLLSSTRFNAAEEEMEGYLYGYDAHGRQIAITNTRVSTVTVLAYDSADRLTSQTITATDTNLPVQTTSFYYNSQGRLWKTELPDGGAVTNEFQANGLLQKAYGTRQYPVEYGYDGQGRLQTLTTWTNYPDASSDAITTWNFDPTTGFLTNKAYHGGSGPSYGYTAGGRLQTRLSESSYATTTYTTNNAGEIGTITYDYNGSPIEPTANLTFTRDGLGRPTGIQHGQDFTMTLNYTDAGFVGNEIHTGGPFTNLTVDFSYLNGQFRGYEIQNIDLANQPINIFYDAGRLDSITFTDPVTMVGYSVEYSPLPNSSRYSTVTWKKNGNALMTAMRTWDGLDRLSSITTAFGETNVAGFTYQYNQANQRTGVTRTDNSRWAYGYDSLGQVTSGKRYWDDDAPVAGQQFEYGFDTIGNRRQSKTGGNGSGAYLRTDHYSVDRLNRNLELDHSGFVSIVGEADADTSVKVNGLPTERKGAYYAREIVPNSVWQGVTNVVIKPSTDGQSETFTKETGQLFAPPAVESFDYQEGNLIADSRWNYYWDAENRLARLHTLGTAIAGGVPEQELRHQYDWQNRRLTKVVSNKVAGAWTLASHRKFVYHGWNLIAEVDDATGEVRNHIWGLDLSGTFQGAGGVGGLLATVIASGPNQGVYFPAYDGSGNVVAYVATNGLVVAEYEYGPFGEMIRASGPMAKVFNFLFSTKYYDWESGLYYYGYRYYNPNTGRWLSRDPLEEGGCINLCAFVFNNPQFYVDDLGTKPQHNSRYDPKGNSWSYKSIPFEPGGPVNFAPNLPPIEHNQRTTPTGPIGSVADGFQLAADVFAVLLEQFTLDHYISEGRKYCLAQAKKKGGCGGCCVINLYLVTGRFDNYRNLCAGSPVFYSKPCFMVSLDMTLIDRNPDSIHEYFGRLGHKHHWSYRWLYGLTHNDADQMIYIDNQEHYRRYINIPSFNN